MAKTFPKHHPTKTSNQLRIIGGQWRGRKLNFPTVDGLRPTPDRVRETLFNWLAPVIVDAHCLDLFSGSGALGFEALSRGAAHVDFVDTSNLVTQQLKLNLQTLQCNNASIHNSQALPWLQQPQQCYDLIFLDPPFGKNLAGDCIDAIHSQQWLKENSWVYLETSSHEPLPNIPHHWQLHREKIAGQVCYRLFKAGQA